MNYHKLQKLLVVTLITILLSISPVVGVSSFENRDSSTASKQEQTPKMGDQISNIGFEPSVTNNPRGHSQPQKFQSVNTPSNQAHPSDKPIQPQSILMDPNDVSIDATTLEDGLDTSLSFTTGGDGYWQYQTSTTYDGTDAVNTYTDPNTNGQTATIYLETTIPNKGMVEFYWYRDKYEVDVNFMVDGSTVLSTDTETYYLPTGEWQLMRANISAEGSHTLRWEAIVDIGKGSSGGISFLDQLTYYENQTGMVEITSPASSNVWTAGSSNTLTWTDSFVVEHVDIELWRDNTYVDTLKSNYEIMWIFTFNGDVSYHYTNNYIATLPTGLTPSTNYTIRLADVSNNYNNFTSASFEIISAINIGDATESTYLDYDINGWAGFVEDSTDGIDSAKSIKATSRGQTKTISTTVEGEGNITFFGKVVGSSSDLLQVYVDGTKQLEIAGSSGWTEYSVYLDTVKTHTVTWRFYQGSYTYDYSYEGALLDNITWTQAQDAINIINPSTSSNWVKSSIYVIDWYYSGDITDVSIDLYKNSVFLQNIVSTTPNDKAHPWTVPDTLSTGSDYQIKITSVTNSSATDMSDMFTITSLTYEEAIDYTPDAISSGGDSPWKNVINIHNDGEDSIQAGDISNNQVSWFNITVTGAGYLEFYWMVNSEAGDMLSLYIDNTLISSISGDQSFVLFDYIIETDGTHIISFGYEKDGSGTLGADSGWIDQVNYDTNADAVIIDNPTMNWLTNETYTITWSHIGVSTEVKIELYKGGSYYSTITTSTANDGTFDWSISLYLLGGSDYSIYIESLSNTATNDESDQITIEETPHIEVINPVSSSAWYRESTYQIQWNETGNHLNVKIELFENGILNYTVTSSTANDGSFSWTLPTYELSSGDQYTIIITATDDETLSDTSDQFSILAPTITVNRPTSGEILTNNTMEYIRWTWTSNFANVIIELYNSTDHLVAFPSLLTANDGTFLWSIPIDIEEGNYYLKFYSESDNRVTALSDVFSIQYPISLNEALDNYELIFTNVGDYPFFGQHSYFNSDGDAVRSNNFPSGNSAELQTTVQGDGVLSFEYRHDGDDKYNDIEYYISSMGTDLLPFSYRKWTSYSVEILGGGSHTITWEHWKYMDDVSSTGSAFLDNITWSPYPPDINITSPEPASTVAVGGNYPIEFETVGPFEYVKIAIYDAGTLVQTIVEPTWDDGYYSWSVGSISPGDYQLRVSSAEDASIYDEIAITIEEKPVITITNPSTGVEWEELTTYNIQWDVTGTVVTHIRLQLYKSTSTIIDFGILPDNGSLQWQVPEDPTPGTDYRFRVTSANQSSFSAYGDYFAIDEIHEIGIVQPVSSTAWPNATDVTIQWEYNGTFANVGIELWQNGLYTSTLVSSTTNDGAFVWSIPGDIDLGNYQIRIYQADNPEINTTSAEFTITENINLDEATDSNLGLTTSGDAIWIGQSDVTYNDNDAAESGAIGDNQQVSLEFTVFGSGTLSFYWKVSSQSTDYLTLYIDGVMITQISGEQDWIQYTTSVLDGGSSHTIRWVYHKDSSGSAGADTAWIDLITWTEDTDSINVTSPTSGDLWEKGEYTITWTSLGTVSEVNITVYVNSTYVMSLVNNTANDGSYTWTIGNELSSGIGYIIRITVADNPGAYGDSDIFELFILTLNEAVDNNELPLSTGGYLPWTTTESEFYQGGDAIRAGIIAGDKVSWVEFEVNGTGYFRFYMKFDVGFLDDVNIYINSNYPTYYYDGTQGWTLFEFYIDEVGINTIRIEYENWSSADSSEYVYIDAVTWSPLGDNLDITSPNEGDQFTSGDTQYLRWTYNGTSFSVKFEVYQSGSLISTITSSTANDGSLYFTMPSLTNGDYYLRITSTTNSSNYDEIMITIVDPYVAITSPTSASQWEIGTQYRITWDEIGDDGFIIQLFKDGNFLTNLTSYWYISGGYATWTPSDTLEPGTDYQIKLIYSTDTSVTDISDSFELLEQRSLSVIDPSSSSIWINGSTYDITWDSTGAISMVNITLYQGSTAIVTIVEQTTNDGIYTWTVPSDLTYATNYVIKIGQSNDGSVYDASANFVISQPIVIHNPVAGDSYLNETTQTITWFAIDSITEVNIILYIDGIYYSTLISNYQNNGSYSWYIENSYPESTNVWIHIEDSAEATVFGISETFTLTKPAISLNNAVDNYDISLEFQDDTWIAQDTITHDGFDALKTADISSHGITSMSITVFGTGIFSFYWRVSSESNYDFFSYTANGDIVQISGAPSWAFVQIEFTTVGYHTITFTYEKDGSVSSYDDAGYLDQITWSPDEDGLVLTDPTIETIMTPGMSYQITWETTGGVEMVYIELYMGSEFVLTISEEIQNMGSYQWSVPTSLNADTTYQIKIINADNTSISDITGEFEILKYITPAEAIDSPLDVNTSWNGQSEISHDGTDALYSGESGSGTTKVTIYINGTGTLSFYYRFSTNYFSYYLDGNLVLSTSNAGTSWKYYTHDITTSGDHTLTFAFYVQYDTDSDYAWLDEVIWIEDEPVLSAASTDSTEYYDNELITVTWDSVGSITSVDLFLMVGTTVVGEAFDLSNNGELEIGLPSNLEYGLEYFIRIQASDNSSIYTDTSVFTILEQLYLHYIDNIEDSYDTGDEITITWNGSSSIENIGIRLYSGNSVKVQISSSTANDGSYTWTIDSSVSDGSYSIKISSETLEDTSDEFTINQVDDGSSDDPNDDGTGDDTTDEDTSDDTSEDTEGGFLPATSLLMTVIIMNLLAFLYSKIFRRRNTLSK